MTKLVVFEGPPDPTYMEFVARDLIGSVPRRAQARRPTNHSARGVSNPFS